MSTLYKRKDSPYWWWTTKYKGKTYSKSTKMKPRKLAKQIQQQWDYMLMVEDLEFLGLSHNGTSVIKDYVKEYIDFLGHRKSENTITNASSALKRWCVFLKSKGIIRFEEVNVKLLNEYIDSMTTSAPKTIKNHMGIISRMFDQAIREEITEKNPAKHVTLPEIIRVIKHRPLNQIDLEIIFNNAGKWELYYSFLYLTGLRAGDVAVLKHGDIDCKRKAITGLVRKSRRIHELPLAEELLELIPPGDADQPIFPELYSENEIRLNGLIYKPRKYLQDLLKKNDLPKATLHSFRVTFNNALRDLGLSIEDRQVLLAHSSSETTKIYTHPNFKLATEYVNRIPLFNFGKKDIVGES